MVLNNFHSSRSPFENRNVMGIIHMVYYYLSLYVFIFMLILTLLLVAKLCPTLCNPMDCSLPDSSVHGISQARILENIEYWSLPFSSPGDLPHLGIELASPVSPALAGGFFTMEPLQN